MVFHLFIDKKEETPPHWEVFPEGLEVQDPPLPESGVIRRCDPRQRRFASVLTGRRLLNASHLRP